METKICFMISARCTNTVTMDRFPKLAKFPGLKMVLLYYHIPHVNNKCKTLVQDTKILTMLLLSVIEKFID